MMPGTLRTVRKKKARSYIPSKYVSHDIPLFGYFQTESEEREVTVGEEVNVITVAARWRAGEAAGDRKRRDIVVAISHIPSLDCYLTASQKGTLSVYTSKESAWVTGCDYMPRIKRIIACTERSLCVWDSRAKGKAQSMFFIKPIEHSPQCLTWIPYPTDQHNEDVIIYGDDQGYINLVTLSTKDFTTPQHANRNQRYTSSQCIDPNKLTHPIRRRKLHDNWVLKVKWFPELQCFGSCSSSSTSSFVLEGLDQILNDGDVRGVSISKGVNSFDYCAKANIVATGGVDKVIRVWHPHIFTRPTGKLIGHLFTIVDIVCNEKDQHLISLSTARVIRIWDIHTLTSLQVFTDNEERPGEKRVYAMLFSNKHDHLLTGSSVLDVWPLTRAVQDTMQVPHTHDRPISQILFNTELNQLVTICTESVIRLWEIDTGKEVYHISDAHGPNMEISAVCVDKSGYRMATGACDGSVKVWDLGSGQQIKHKIGRGTDDDLSINGLFYSTVEGERALVIQGWNNKLRVYKDTNEGTDLMLLKDFDDVHYVPNDMNSPTKVQKTPLPELDTSRTSAHITDIFRKNCLLSVHELSCVTSSLPDVFATGCNDGSIILWNIKRSCVDKVLVLPGQENKPPQPILRQKSKSHIFSRGNSRSQLISVDNSKRVNAIRFMIHRVRRLDPKYIKQLTALRSKSEDADELERGERDSSNLAKKTPRLNKLRRSSRRFSTYSQLGQDVSEQEQLTTKETRPEVETLEEDENENRNSEEAKLSTKDPGSVRPVSADSIKKPYEDDEDFDPESRMLVDTYDPVLVSCHSDSFIRFWNMNGDFLREITAVTRRQGSPVTALCTDPDCNILITGDNRGYVTVWDIGDFLKTPKTDDIDLIKQVVCWRAHLTRIVQLEYILSQKAVLSGSTDGSVRIWCPEKGRYVGFFGQQRPFNFPNDNDEDNAETVNNNILPYDITEGPLKPVKTISAKQKMKTSTQQFEYPLMFDNEKWKPFRRSAYIRQQDSRIMDQPTDKKFFGALIKPKPVKQTLDSSTTGEMIQGAVFRALPVYRIQTPARLKTPQFSRQNDDSDMPFVSLSVPTLHHKFTKGGKNMSDRKKSRPRRGSVLVSTGNHGNMSSLAPSDFTQLTSLASSSPRR
ncbi:hypothetical protein LSH36_94g03011 [Paralvinella palmiformis]|uniref:Uncharacterized protein n=1 Tax=Paralvinella palmiformis TaxID=53620 RepID=A0AAD9K2C1_9ANNE|nr:hypothetical protein LSH36_94g03011 [Paralvinella palmiformis]